MWTNLSPGSPGAKRGASDRLLAWVEKIEAWMEAQGYAISTTTNSLGNISNYFHWCDEQRFDPNYRPGFSPAAGLKRLNLKRYATANLLSKEKVG